MFILKFVSPVEELTYSLVSSRVSGKITVKCKSPQTGIQASGNQIQMQLKKTLEITEKLIWLQKGKNLQTCVLRPIFALMFSRGAVSEDWNRVYMMAPVKKFGRVRLSTNFPQKQI